MKRTDLEALKACVDRLDPYEQQQVFQIVQNYTQEFTRTQEGVLVQASVLPEKCLQEMKNYTQFCLDQKRRMEEDADARKNYERWVSTS